MALARPLLALLAGLLALAPAMPLCAREPSPQPGMVALTFDDLPALTLYNRQPYVDAYMRRLTRALSRHRFPVIGFVNEGKFGDDDMGPARQQAIVRTWLASGLALGNHTLSHESPDSLGVQGYVEDIAAGEKFIRPLLARRHQPLVWFRHPYLKTGSTPAIRQPVDDWLAAHHYRVAPVTMDADDWEFSEPYDYWLAKGDRAAAARVRAQYLDYARARIAWYRQAARALFGRDIGYVFLMHATRLNADTLDDFARLLAEQKLRVVPLEQAVRDPAYRTPDPYYGPESYDWMDRWALQLGKALPANKPHVPADVASLYDRLDDD